MQVRALFIASQHYNIAQLVIGMTLLLLKSYHTVGGITPPAGNLFYCVHSERDPVVLKTNKNISGMILLPLSLSLRPSLSVEDCLMWELYPHVWDPCNVSSTCFSPPPIPAFSITHSLFLSSLLHLSASVSNQHVMKWLI